jgi:hypothetical protein
MHLEAMAWAVAALMLAGTAQAAMAPRPAPPAPLPGAGSATVSVLGIRASNDARAQIDPDLGPVADELKRLKYNSFRVVANVRQSVPVGQSVDVAMPEDYVLRVEVAKAADRPQLVVSWLKPKDAPAKQRIEMTVPKGKYFLTGGWTLKDGALWAAVSAQ